MATKTNNGTNKTASKTRKGGPRGKRALLSPAQLREKILRELMVKEHRKVDTKLTRLMRRIDAAHDKLEAMKEQRIQLLNLLEQYEAEIANGK